MNTTKTHLTGITAALALCLTIPTQAANAVQKEKSHHGHRKQLLERFDADGDGKLNETEKAAAKEARKKYHAEIKAKMLARFDSDKDGKLSKDERKAARETIKKEHHAIKAAVLKEFDKDGNGELSKEERSGVKEWIKKNYPNALPPHRHHKKHGKKDLQKKHHKENQ